MDAPLENHYIHHLALLNHRAVTTHDIYSDDGKLLLRKGVSFESSCAQQLSQHTLLRPIYCDLLLGNELSADQLVDDLTQAISQYEDWLALEESNPIFDEINTFCLDFCSQTALRQNLTVLAERLPELYNKSLFIAFFAVAVAKASGLTYSTRRSLFFSGLLQDLGMLYLPDPKLICNTAVTSSSIWQKHPRVGYRILKNIQGVPNEVLDAVLAHHEHLDGSGYPEGKSGAQLSALGQIIGISAVVYEMRFSAPAELNISSLSHILPLFQVCGDLYKQSLLNECLKLIGEACEPKLRYRQLDKHFFNAQLKQIDALNDHCGTIKKLQHYLQQSDASCLTLTPVIVRIEHVIKTMQRAGIEFEGLTAWLKVLMLQTLPVSEDEQLVLEEFDMVLQQLSLLYKRLQQALQTAPFIYLLKHLNGADPD